MYKLVYSINHVLFFVTYTIATDLAGLSTTVLPRPLLVDTTPPTAGRIELDLRNNLYVSSDSLSLHLTGFRDEESGIDHFKIGIGSHKDINDVVANSKYYGDFVVIDLRVRVLIDTSM